MWDTSNPALRNDDAFQEYYGRMAERADVATLPGIVNRTALLVGVAILAGGGTYTLVSTHPSILFLSNAASLLVALGVFFVIYRKPQAAVIAAPLYAVAEGAFLGALSGALDGVLQSRGYAVTSVALQAFIITASIMIAMLLLYRAGLLRPTKLLVSVVTVATGGIMITYLISWPVSLLLGRDLPLIGLSSAVGGGWVPLAGLGINLAILGIASLWLIIDFKTVEELAAGGGPRYLEWYGAFALLVTLAWIYYEAVKLAYRLAIMFGNRD
jgi:uncharacterized YccA/Bax inhibitor family protein